MRTVAVLPINHLTQVKSRLAASPVDRPRLALDLLLRALKTLQKVDEVEACWVVSPDPEVVSHLNGLARWVAQTSQGLNPALEEACQQARREGFQRILVTLPDLPFLESGEVRDFLALVRDPGTLAVAADRWNQGTNLWLSFLSPSPPFFFGEGSLAAHQQAAQRLGWRCQVFRSPGSERDLDTIEDWEEFRWSLPSNCCR